MRNDSKAFKIRVGEREKRSKREDRCCSREIFLSICVKQQQQPVRINVIATRVEKAAAAAAAAPLLSEKRAKGLLFLLRSAGKKLRVVGGCLEESDGCGKCH